MSGHGGAAAGAAGAVRRGSPLAMPQRLDRVVVVGASLAGLRACEALRRQGVTGAIHVVDCERAPFYDRPPLSKQLLRGLWDRERIALRDEAALRALELEPVLGHRAVSFDAAARRVELDDGSRLVADGVVLCCGAGARELPGAPRHEAIRLLRSYDDAVALRELMQPGSRLLVAGAGFLGLEVAASARGLGVEVTVVEALSWPLARVLGPLLGEVVARLHEAHGVSLRLGTGITALVPRSTSGGPVRVELAAGEAVEADAVLVAIGARPETAWLEGSGLELADGVLSDETLAAAPGVVVAGDAARVVSGEAATRLEHWSNAAEQGAHAAERLAAGMTGAPARPFVTVPYFWSDQYDLKLQAIGLPDPAAEVEIVQGSLAEGRFVACYGVGGRFVAAVGFGRPRQLMLLRPLLERPSSLAEAVAAAS